MSELDYTPRVTKEHQHDLVRSIMGRAKMTINEGIEQSIQEFFLPALSNVQTLYQKQKIETDGRGVFEYDNRESNKM